MTSTSSPTWRRHVLELLILVTLVIGLKKVFDPFFWRFAGPVALAVTMGLLAIYLKRSGQSWESLGVRRLPRLKDKLLLIPQVMLTFAAMAAAIAGVTYLGEIFDWTFMQEMPEGVDARWGDVKGNLPLFLVWVTISWVIAGFSEEVLFRGVIITRLSHLFGPKKIATVSAVILAGVFFGYLHHYNQGLRGFITAGMIGIAFGAMFIVFKRNLWPIIIVHGCIDTLGFTVRFLDLPV